MQDPPGQQCQAARDQHPAHVNPDHRVPMPPDIVFVSSQSDWSGSQPDDEVRRVKKYPYDDCIIAPGQLLGASP
jgi:hypothetical protein